MKALAALLLAVASPAMAAPMSYAQFKAIPQPPAPRTIAYGPDPLQHVELWKPAGRGPFPVVLMLHGGCWQTAVAKAGIMHLLAADLTKRGIAVWNIEYLGIDVPGGGYPGTFLDVAAAADMLGHDGPGLGLDTRRVVAVGHSAGGHLGPWLAARRRIARTSVLWTPHPLRIAGVLSQGGLPDLAASRTQAAEACGDDTIDRLVGPATTAHPHVYADTSPAALAPIGVPQWLVNGALDPVAPPRVATGYAARMRAAGDAVQVEIIPDAGHFELILPTTPAWARQVGIIETMLAQPRPR